MISETYLGLRHGPMSFLTPETLVLCLLSSDPMRRLYEIDLIQELRSKKLGYSVGIAGTAEHGGLFDDVIPAVLPEAPDDMRTPFEILIPQLLGYHLSRRLRAEPGQPESRWRDHPCGSRGHDSRWGLKSRDPGPPPAGCCTGFIGCGKASLAHLPIRITKIKVCSNPNLVIPTGLRVSCYAAPINGHVCGFQKGKPHEVYLRH